MAYTIDTAWVRQYQDDVLHLAAQRNSRLRDTVMEKSVTGQSLEIERIGSVDAVTKASRHAATPESEVPHSRRRVSMLDKHWAEMIDAMDEARMLIDPSAAYQAELVGAYNRDYDAAIIAALGGNAVAVAADGTESNVTLGAGQTIVHGSAGMSVAKIREAREKFLTADVDMDYSECFIVLSGKQQMELLNDSELTSADFSNIQRLITGDLDGSFLGFKFRRSEQLDVATNIRDCFAYTKSAICLGTALDMKVNVNERPDKSNSKQIYAEWSRGAVRQEEAQVVKIECSEA